MTVTERLTPKPPVDRRPAWIRRMQEKGLPPKDLTGKVAA